MTVTVALDLTELYDFDSASDVTSSQGTPGLDTDFKAEGGGSVAAELRSTGVQWIKYTRSSGSWDLQNTHIYIWMNCIFASLLANKANGGLRILVGDGTNVGYWYCEGSDTYVGGFICLVADTAQALDSGSCTLSAVTEIGIGVNFTTGAKNVESTWVDIARFGDGITVTSDAPCDLDDILIEAQSNVNASGIIRKSGGVFFLQGKLRLGDGVGTGSITFEEKSKDMIYEDKKVSSSLYEIIIQGNATGTTSVKFGEKSGTVGISGCKIKSNAVGSAFKITASDTDVDAVGFYGCTFDTYDVIDLMPDSANREVLDCNFENGQGQIQPSTMTFARNKVIGGVSTDGSVLYESISHNISYTTYIDNSRAAEFPAAGTYAMTGDRFTGGTYDIHFSATTGDLIINAGGDPKANPDPGQVENDSTGTVTINNTVSITITAKNTSEVVIEGARVLLRAATGGDLPFEEGVTIVRSGSTATVTHTAHGLETGDKVEIEGADQPEYNGAKTIIVTTVDAYTFTVSGTPTTPATGTIKSTAILLEDLTNASGIASAIHRYTNDQPFSGWARKSSSSPFYKESIISGTIINSDYAVTMFLTSDE